MTLAVPSKTEVLRLARHVQSDLQTALTLVSSGNMTYEALTSHEMKVLYVVLALFVSLTVKPVRRLAFKTVDTLVALVLLVAISAVVLGIPFLMTYLGGKALMHVGTSLLVYVKTLL
jgi:hypothetical protein